MSADYYLKYFLSTPAAITITTLCSLSPPIKFSVRFLIKICGWDGRELWITIRGLFVIELVRTWRVAPTPSLGSKNKHTTKQQNNLQSVPEVLFISILTSCRWASLSHRARQAETWKDPTKKLSKGFKFHPKKSCCCWAPRVDLYQSKSIVCHEHSSVARDHDVTVTHSGSQFSLPAKNLYHKKRNLPTISTHV